MDRDVEERQARYAAERKRNARIAAMMGRYWRKEDVLAEAEDIHAEARKG